MDVKKRPVFSVILSDLQAMLAAWQKGYDSLEVPKGPDGRPLPGNNAAAAAKQGAGGPGAAGGSQARGVGPQAAAAGVDGAKIVVDESWNPYAISTPQGKRGGPG